MKRKPIIAAGLLSAVFAAFMGFISWAQAQNIQERQTFENRLDSTKAAYEKQLKALTERVAKLEGDKKTKEKQDELDKYNLIFLNIEIDPVMLGEERGWNLTPWVRKRMRTVGTITVCICPCSSRMWTMKTQGTFRMS